MRIVVVETDPFFVFKILKKFENIREIVNYLEANYQKIDYDITDDGYAHHIYKIDDKHIITVLVNFLSPGFLRYHYVYLETKDEIIDSFRIIEDDSNTSSELLELARRKTIFEE